MRVCEWWEGRGAEERMWVEDSMSQLSSCLPYFEPGSLMVLELIHQAGQPASSRILLSMPPTLALGLQMNPASLAFLLGSGDRSLVSVCIASPLLIELCRYVP